MKRFFVLLFLLISTMAHAQSGEIWTGGRTTSGVIVQDESSTLTQATYLDFTGAGVSVTSDGQTYSVSISGSAEGSITSVGSCTSGDCLQSSGAITVDTITADSVYANGVTADTVFVGDGTQGGDVYIQFDGDGGQTAKLNFDASEDAVSIDTVFQLHRDSALVTDTVADLGFDTDAWAAGRGAAQIHDGTATTYLIGVLSSDSPNDGEVIKWNTGGTLTFETDNNDGGATGSDTAVAFFDGDDNLSSDLSGMNFNKNTDTLTVGKLATSPNANPQTTYQDSNVTDGGDNAVISLDCPVPTSGNEGCELTLSHMVGGVTVDSVILGNQGGVTLDTVYALSGITTDSVQMQWDTPYNSGWDGDLTLPTKNAVYDKIEEIGTREYCWSAIDTEPFKPVSVPSAGTVDAVAPTGKDTGTNSEKGYVAYDDTADEYRKITFKVPSNLDTSSNVTIRVKGYAATAAAQDVAIVFAWHEISDAESWDGALTEETLTTTLTNTQDVVDTFTKSDESSSDMGWAANDEIDAFIGRDGDHASDDGLSGDFHMTEVCVEIP